MPDKPPKEDRLGLWKRVLSSIPHGLKIRAVSVRGTGDKKAEEFPEPMEPPPETPTPGPFGME